MEKKLFYVVYRKDGIGPCVYQIPATDELNAAVRLGQIYGDRPNRNDREIEILDVLKNYPGDLSQWEKKQ